MVDDGGVGPPDPIPPPIVDRDSCRHQVRHRVLVEHVQAVVHLGGVQVVATPVGP